MQCKLDIIGRAIHSSLVLRWSFGWKLCQAQPWCLLVSFGIFSTKCTLSVPVNQSRLPRQVQSNSTKVINFVSKGREKPKLQRPHSELYSLWQKLVQVTKLKINILEGKVEWIIGKISVSNDKVWEHKSTHSAEKQLLRHKHYSSRPPPVS